MSKLRDPNVDALFRTAQPASGPTIAAPLNDIQLVALVSSIIGASTQQVMAPHQAVSTAIQLVAESITQISGGALTQALNDARQRVALGGATLLPTQ